MNAGGDSKFFLKQSALDMLHKTLFFNYCIRMLFMCYILVYSINDRKKNIQSTVDFSSLPSSFQNEDSLKQLCLILRYESYIKGLSQQNSSFKSLCITSLLLVGLEQPLCWWLWRLFRPGWLVGSEGSHTATTVVSIRESVYMLLWRATLCRMARSSSSS